mgnify:CR=1 FL=1
MPSYLDVWRCVQRTHISDNRHQPIVHGFHGIKSAHFSIKAGISELFQHSCCILFTFTFTWAHYF